MSSLQRGVDMKEKEEVAEYLENLGIEYRFGCYKEKKPKGKAICFCGFISFFGFAPQITGITSAGPRPRDCTSGPWCKFIDFFRVYILHTYDLIIL